MPPVAKTYALKPVIVGLCLSLLAFFLVDLQISSLAATPPKLDEWWDLGRLIAISGPTLDLCQRISRVSQQQGTKEQIERDVQGVLNDKTSFTAWPQQQMELLRTASSRRLSPHLWYALACRCLFEDARTSPEGIRLDIDHNIIAHDGDYGSQDEFILIKFAEIGPTRADAIRKIDGQSGAISLIKDQDLLTDIIMARMQYAEKMPKLIFRSITGVTRADLLKKLEVALGESEIPHSSHGIMIEFLTEFVKLQSKYQTDLRMRYPRLELEIDLRAVFQEYAVYGMPSQAYTASGADLTIRGRAPGHAVFYRRFTTKFPWYNLVTFTPPSPTFGSDSVVADLERWLGRD